MTEDQRAQVDTILVAAKRNRADEAVARQGTYANETLQVTTVQDDAQLIHANLTRRAYRLERSNHSR